MKNPKLLTTVIALALFSCSNEQVQDNPSDELPTTSVEQEQAQEAEPFIVLELFSSEGCSDCPAAEALLNKVTKEAMANKTYVYPLAFHVDYWNKLGWKDVFADSAYSNRQRKYRTAFKNEVVYTPQMIANGQIEYVGSDEDKTTALIDSFLNVTPEWYFTIHPDESKLKEGDINTTYEVIKKPSSPDSVQHQICFAIVERKLESNITRGENKGIKLVHENVVRYFKTQELTSDAGSLQINYAAGNITKNHSLIAFIQEQPSMKIVGANIWNF